ncbi:MAG: SCO family protein, partial [Brevundimonas sp.]|nr:SCO family protein [Brevundimonas sp.]
YAFCPDACPTDVAVMMRGFQQFEKQHPAKAAKVQPLFATIDPTRDTQQVVKEFTDSFHPRLLGLTGTQAEVDTAAKAFRVYAARGKDLGNGAYLMDHSRFAYLMDPDGKPLVILAVDKSAEAVAADLAVMVR